MKQSAYYVYEGNTLGYVNRAQPSVFCPLSANIHGRDWRNGPFHLLPAEVDALSPATLEDFERFRVCPKGHIAPLDTSDRDYDWRNG